MTCPLTSGQGNRGLLLKDVVLLLGRHTKCEVAPANHEVPVEKTRLAGHLQSLLAGELRTSTRYCWSALL